MILGLELLARRAVRLTLGTYFETWIATDSAVHRSLGRDEYHLALAIEPGHRLAATGRTHICQVDLNAADMGPNEARPAAPVQVSDTEPAVVAGLRTNLFLSLPALVDGVIAHVVVDGRSLLLPLNQEQLPVTEVSPGRFILDLTQVTRAPT